MLDLKNCHESLRERKGNKNKNSSFPTRSSLRYFGFIENLRQEKALHRIYISISVQKSANPVVFFSSQLVLDNVIWSVQSGAIGLFPLLSPPAPVPEHVTPTSGGLWERLYWEISQISSSFYIKIATFRNAYQNIHTVESCRQCSVKYVVYVYFVICIYYIKQDVMISCVDF